MSLYASGTDWHAASNGHVENISTAAQPAVPYAIRAVPERRLVHIKISGFWTADMIGDFARDLGAAITGLGCGPNQHLTCCDVSDAAIQPQDVIAAFQQLIASDSTQSRKMALFTTRPLSRMQSRRLVAVRDNIAVFDTEDAALGWLHADESEPA